MTHPEARGRRRRWLLLTAIAAVLVIAAVVVVVVVRSHKAPTAVPTPRPTPSVSRTPSVSPTPTPSPWTGPGATNTGVPAGTTLSASGPLFVTKDRTVIQGKDIHGCVDVKANDVTIKDTRITCARPTTAIRVFDGYGGLTVEDVEIDGSDVVGEAIGYSGYTVLRANIHDVVDGPRMSDNTQLIDSWVHGLARVGGSHNDTVQTTGGSHIVVRHNTLEAYDAQSGDLFNSAIQVGSTTAPVNDLLIENNYLDGGNYTVNFRADLVATDVVARGNIFGPNHRYGELLRPDLPGITWDGGPSPTP